MRATEREALLLASAAVVSVACAKLGSAIGDDAAVMVGGPSLRGDLEVMKTMLEAIGALLEMRSTDEEWVRVRRWLARVKKAAYDIWDMLDDLQANNTTPPAANTIRTGMLTRLAIVRNATNKIASRTNKMRDDLRVILQESPSFSSDIWSSYASEGRRETPPPHIVEETIITGRDEDKERIVLAVLSATDDIREGKGPIILPIVGLPGIGKTTLAKLVSDDTRFKDYSKVWACASGNFDLLEIGRSIISQLLRAMSIWSSNDMEFKIPQLSGAESKDSNDMEFIIPQLSGAESKDSNDMEFIIPQLSGAESKDSNDMEYFIMGRLNELLGGKKLLVVLDDLWREDLSELERLREMLRPYKRWWEDLSELDPLSATANPPWVLVGARAPPPRTVVEEDPAGPQVEEPKVEG